MKVRAYIRVAKNGYKVKLDASAKESGMPLFVPSGYKEKKYLPTVKFALDLVIPDDLFSTASRVLGEIDISAKDIQIAAELPMPSATQGEEE